MIIHTDGAELLNELVRANLDLETAFTVCAYATRNNRLGIMLLARARLCGEAARTLSATLGTPACKRDDSLPSKPSATDWVALHDALLVRDDTVVRNECARIEEDTLMRFRDVLEYDLPVSIQRVVQKYFAALLEHYGSLRALDVPGLQSEPRYPALRIVPQATISRHA